MVRKFALLTTAVLALSACADSGEDVTPTPGVEGSAPAAAPTTPSEDTASSSPSTDDSVGRTEESDANASGTQVADASNLPPIADYFTGNRRPYAGEMLTAVVGELGMVLDDSGHTLTAFDLVTGGQRWQAQLPESFTDISLRWLDSAIAVEGQVAGEASGLDAAKSSTQVLVLDLDTGAQRREVVEVPEGFDAKDFHDTPFLPFEDGRSTRVLLADGTLSDPVPGIGIEFLRNKELVVSGIGMDEVSELLPPPAVDASGDKVNRQIRSDRAVRVFQKDDFVNSVAEIFIQVYGADLEPLGEATGCSSPMEVGGGGGTKFHVSPTRSYVAYGSAIADLETGVVTCLDGLSEGAVKVLAIGDDGSAWVAAGLRAGFVSAEGELGQVYESGSTGPFLVLPNGVVVVEELKGPVAYSAP